MKPQTNKTPAASSRAAALGAAAISLLGLGSAAQAQIDATNWGSVTAPVFGVPQSGTYAGADLFAGPNQFGSYYAGVLPDGKNVTPAGSVTQIGMNPLGVAVTPDGNTSLPQTMTSATTGRPRTPA